MTNDRNSTMTAAEKIANWVHDNLSEVVGSILMNYDGAIEEVEDEFQIYINEYDFRLSCIPVPHDMFSEEIITFGKRILVNTIDGDGKDIEISGYFLLKVVCVLGDNTIHNIPNGSPSSIAIYRTHVYGTMEYDEAHNEVNARGEQWLDLVAKEILPWYESKYLT